MSNYQESTITGQIKKWKRAFQLVIRNTYNQIPLITFMEETATQFPDNSIITEPAGQLEVLMPSPLTEFPLINPLDGTSLGSTMTMQQLQVAMHSAYLFLAAERDHRESMQVASSPVGPNVHPEYPEV
jgi:hypothetical protein